MNIFKGLLFLQNYSHPADYEAELEDQIRRQFGARTAAADFAAPLGNRAAARRRFGPADARVSPLPEAGCVAGGCG